MFARLCISEFKEKIVFAAHTFEIVEEAHARLSADPSPDVANGLDQQAEA